MERYYIYDMYIIIYIYIIILVPDVEYRVWFSFAPAHPTNICSYVHLHSPLNKGGDWCWNVPVIPEDHNLEESGFA